MLVKLGFNFIKKIHYGVSSRSFFMKNGLNYWYRDVMSEGRVRLFDLYIYDKHSIQKFLTGIDEKGKIIAQKSLDNIIMVSQNNYCHYSELYDQRLIDDQKEFAQYVLDKKGKYFPHFDYLYLTNDYYIAKTLPGLCDNVNGKSILDCGAFIGDTAVPFIHMFPDSTIYAFEPESHNYQKLCDVIRYNNLENKIIPVELGVGDQNITTTISDGGAGAKVGEGTSEIKIVTIDSYVIENNINVGLIKWDIEGFEYESLLGAEETIKKDKPVLIISLYHRGKDFFEIKPLLESWNLGYKFTVRKWNCFHPFADTVLICY